MHTYEISQYQRKALNESGRRMKNTAASSNMSYDTYFNTNLKKGVTFDDCGNGNDNDNDSRLQERMRELKLLRIDNAKKANKINALQSQVIQLNNDLDENDNELDELHRENKDLKQLLNQNKNKLKEIEDNRDTILDQNSKLANEIKALGNQMQQLQKEKKGSITLIRKVNEDNRSNSDKMQPKSLLNQQYESELNHLRNQIEKLNDINKQLHNDNKQIKKEANSSNEQLIEENNRLKNDIYNIGQYQPSIDQLKNQILKLNNHISVLERDEANSEKAQITNKKINEDIINELNAKNSILNKDIVDLNKKLFDMKKNSQSLVREKESLIDNISQLENTIKSLELNRKGQRKLNQSKGNDMLIECLKNGNEDLKNLNQRMRRLIDLLISFVNRIGGLFGLEELSLDNSFDDLEGTKEYLNRLEEEIGRLIGENNDIEDKDKKWNEIEDKMKYNRPKKHPLINSLSMKEDEDDTEGKDRGEIYPLGKCTACNLGCNASLKGCSPLFVKKNTNPTNMPSKKR